jgi:cyclophilin family peptidyl-prolyl cis-trans isomerase
MNVFLKRMVILLAGLALAGPAMAQQTGPEGLAEPHVRALPPRVAAPAPPVVPENILNLQLSSGGTVSIVLRPDKAPLSVERLKILTNRHFYDGLTFHRVIEGFMAQGGDPKGTGEGGSDLPDLKAEFNDLPHVRGTLAMARAQDPNSANSQFYIMLSPNLSLDMNYTVVGRVVAGMVYADRLEKGEPPANPSRIVRAYIGAPPADPATPGWTPPAPPAPPSLATLPTDASVATAPPPAPKAPAKPAPKRKAPVRR